MTKNNGNKKISGLIQYVKILVIDDEDTFPIKLFEKEGYHITKWDKVESLKRLENGEFDIIILDIFDVAKDISENDGLGILEHIKKYNPAQIVVAYSGRTFDLSKNRFWRIADDTLAKPSDFIKCKEIIDNLIKDKFTIEHYVSGLLRLLTENGIEENDCKKIESKINKQIQSNGSLSNEKIIKILPFQTEDIIKAVPAIVGVVDKIIQYTK
jgi:CheY-like chemotaxis protein